MAPARVLRTRLLPPRLPTVCVPRTGLCERVAAALRTDRLVAIVAGAGYGKTTVLAESLERARIPSIWCSCDARLEEPSQLVAHLAAALGERFPGVAAQFPPTADAFDLLTDLWNEVAETVSDDIVVALDDVHALPAKAAAILGPLLSSAPPQVHFGLASRTVLPFPTSRLRTTGLCEIGERELALSAEETRDLLAVLRGGLEGRAAELHRRTEGWLAGLLLAAQVPDGTEPIVPAAFDYLVEEVLGGLPDVIHRFLVDTAVLTRLTPGLAAAVSGRTDAAELLEDLVARHLFTLRLAGESPWYRYHHLLHEVLRRRLAGDPDRERCAHELAAEWWHRQGDVLEAARHLIAAGDPGAAMALVEPAAEVLARSAQAEGLGALLDAAPRRHWDQRPALVLAHAVVQVARGRHEAAFAECASAVERLIALREYERAAATLVRMQQAMMFAGSSPRDRARLAAPLADQIPAETKLLPAARILLATSYGYAGRFSDAEEEIARALALPNAIGAFPVAVLAQAARAFYIEQWAGSPERALEALREARTELEARRHEDPLNAAPFVRVLLDYAYMAAGHYDETIGSLLDAETRAGEVGISSAALRRMYGWGEAYAHVGADRWDEAEAEAPPPQPASAPATPTSYGYRNHVLAARLAGRRGDTLSAGREIAQTCEEMLSFGPAFDDSMFLADLALAAVDAGLSSDARRLAEQACESATQMGMPWSEARAALVGAYVQGVGENGDALLLRALELTISHGFEGLWTRRERPRAALLLARALRSRLSRESVDAILAAGGPRLITEVLDQPDMARDGARSHLARLLARSESVELAAIDRLLRDRDAEVRAAAREAWVRLKARPRAALRILSLGELVVLRDGEAVPQGAFARAKARTLLAALLAAGGSVHREALCEWLWPDLSAERAGAALRTTLYELRRAVEPELEAGHPDSIVAADGDRVSLVLGPRDSWDAAELRSAVLAARTRPENAVEQLGSAEQLYRRAFLSEWPYEDWSEPARTELEELQGELLERLGEALLRQDRPAEAVSRLRQWVRHEPERESAHRALMRAYAASGDRSLALRQYHACRAVLRRTQGVEPGHETRALYEQILRVAESAP